MISHIEALSAVTRTTLKSLKSFHKVEKNWFEIFEIWSNFKLTSKITSNLNSLFKLSYAVITYSLKFFSAILGLKNLKIQKFLQNILKIFFDFFFRFFFFVLLVIILQKLISS